MLEGKNSFFCCEKSGGKIRYFLMLVEKEENLNKVCLQVSQFYALQTHGDHEGSFDAVIGMLKVFQIVVYIIIDTHLLCVFCCYM